MPKINVYVPDELAEAIKESGVPVSAVCQRALETAVRRVTAIREAVLSPSADLGEDVGRMSHFTPRSKHAVSVAVREARDGGAAEVGTEHLLAGLLATEGNLALNVLQAIDIRAEQVRAELDRLTTIAHGVGEVGGQDAGGTAPADLAELRFGAQAAAALELAVTEATSMGHNYVGCEHLLLGLIAEPDGEGGRILRSLGADLRLTRRAVTAALSGLMLMRAQQGEKKPAAGAELADPMAKL
ncbi:MAG: Clp protease N-terminal domain-containing protein, partial [Actinocrinis sp.]